jgi:16S rRNA (uracil1498-N3)-methyltransferase
LRLFLSPEGEHTLKDLPVPQGPVWLMAGPEGGFEPEEARLAMDNGFVAVRLGPRILRTETAALAAISAMQMLWGDFDQ